MIYVTADHHFGHDRIRIHCLRPFLSVGEMDDALITAWNSVVAPSDTVYHLGDFTLGGQKVAKWYFSHLNGIIKVVPGGHDHRWCKKHWVGSVGNYYSRSGAKVEILMPVHNLNINGITIVLSHHAHRVWHKSHYGSLHLYGHSHGRLLGTAHSMDVGVDAVDGYRPISVDEVIERLA